jgi:hypothetical protein
MAKRIYFQSGLKKQSRARMRWQTRQTRSRSLDSFDGFCRAQLERIAPLAQEMPRAVEYPLSSDASPRACMSDFELLEHRK